ncbi:20267_t:CDS:2, partial [Gigaspora rosea]
QFQHADNEFEKLCDDKEHDPASTLLHKPVSTLPEIDHDECKALFLRTRNNSTMLYEELIVKVCEITKTDPRLRSLTKDVGGWYNIISTPLAEFPYDKLNEFISDD